jgi:predicted glycoside hydrolase/deacetylase ChbG (UPF0249 family)
MKKIVFLLASLLATATTFSQDSKNLAELLGYPKDSKLLIIHADDMGLAQSVNTACKQAFASRAITSGSIMMPCPWSLEMITYAKEHPGLDIGVHLTLTAEWKSYKWDGVVSSDQIPSLLDTDKYLYPSVEAFGKAVKVEEAEKEVYAQIDRLIAAGIQPTHIDTHMGSVLANPDLILMYLKLSDKYNLPVLFPREYLAMFPPELAGSLASKIYLLDNLFMIDEKTATPVWIDAYRKGIEALKPGLNQIIVHPAIDNDEMQAISQGHDDFGSAWRQKDLDVVSDPEFQSILKKNKIILIGWKEIRDLMVEDN